MMSLDGYSGQKVEVGSREERDRNFIHTELVEEDDFFGRYVNTMWMYGLAERLPGFTVPVVLDGERTEGYIPSGYVGLAFALPVDVVAERVGVDGPGIELITNYWSETYGEDGPSFKSDRVAMLGDWLLYFMGCRQILENYGESIETTVIHPRALKDQNVVIPRLEVKGTAKIEYLSNALAAVEADFLAASESVLERDLKLGVSNLDGLIGSKGFRDGLYGMDEDAIKAARQIEIMKSVLKSKVVGEAEKRGDVVDYTKLENWVRAETEDPRAIDGVSKALERIGYYVDRGNIELGGRGWSDMTYVEFFKAYGDRLDPDVREEFEECMRTVEFLVEFMRKCDKSESGVEEMKGFRRDMIIALWETIGIRSANWYRVKGTEE